MVKKNELEELIARLESYSAVEGPQDQVAIDTKQAAEILKQVLAVAKVLCGFLG